MFSFNGNGFRNPIKSFEVFVFRSLPDSCFCSNSIELQLDGHMRRHGVLLLSHLHLIRNVHFLECTLGVSHLFYLTKVDLEHTHRIWCNSLRH